MSLTFICDDCAEEFDAEEMANPDEHDSRELCGWCAEEDS